MVQNIIDWRERLKEILIEAGTVGVKQKTLTYSLRSWTRASEIKAQLEVLLEHDHVQKFELDSEELTGGRPVTIWRATTKIMEPLI